MPGIGAPGPTRRSTSSIAAARSIASVSALKNICRRSLRSSRAPCRTIVPPSKTTRRSSRVALAAPASISVGGPASFSRRSLTSAFRSRVPPSDR